MFYQIVATIAVVAFIVMFAFIVALVKSDNPRFIDAAETGCFASMLGILLSGALIVIAKVWGVE